ncbi:hypothetical protein [Vreelandella malpeensis]|uniref:Uncharacterized protein n=1 Tax=Vreelandella malpeensis TaxID=1172368 RepID=A0ABS8DU40_9GAMM|nr:hypothetical protein [Halomonas malpeensis]MCB8889573.1 hypothetical protein [Halomonas malpeensis]
MSSLRFIATLLLVTLVTKPSKWVCRAALFVLGWVVFQIGTLFADLAPLLPGAFAEILEGKVSLGVAIAVGIHLLVLFQLSRTYKSYIGLIHVAMNRRFGVAS